MQSDENRVTGVSQRRLSPLDLAFIWFGAAIAITEIWAGGLPQLTGLGLGLGLLAIVLGRFIGNGMMGAMARIGGLTGLPSMVLARAAFGIRGSALPALINVLQLIGWTGWMLFVGFSYLDTLAAILGLPTADQFPAMRGIWILALGLLCTLWAMGSQRLWQILQRVGAIVLFLLTLAMTLVVITQYDAAQLLAPGAAGFGGLLSAADLVIAMSVSWLPLVADYSRYVRTGTGAGPTFWGYFVGGTWMYAVGLLVALAADTSAPDQMVINVMGSQGIAWALLAAALVLVSTVTTTFLDIFSTVVSTRSMLPAIPRRTGVAIAGALGTLIALVLDVFAYEPFLLAIGLIFLPAFTIVLTDFYLVRHGQLDTAQLEQRGGQFWYQHGFNWRALLAWAAGFVVYDWAGGFSSIGFFADKLGLDVSAAAWPTGSSLPCIVVTALVYFALAKMLPAKPASQTRNSRRA